MAGILYLVATPIGNLGDLSPRAVETLAQADFIAAEDTRVSLRLLNNFDIRKPLVSYHAEVIYAAIKDNLNSICNSIKMILEKTPPELAKDIIHSGIYITGGGSKIHNLDKLFTEITNIKVNSCENPEECAVRGLNKIVSDEKYKHLGFSMKSKIYK